MEYLTLALGFIFLIKGADLFVDGASSLAKRYGIPSLVIGLTIVSFGTGAPEAAISISSAIKGANELTLGNVIGSNIFNLLIVLGVASAISPIYIKRNTIRTEFPFLFLISTVLLILAGDIALGTADRNLLDRGDGLILLCFFLIFLYYLAGLMFKNSEEIEEDVELIPLRKSLSYIALGMIGIWLGGEWVVDSSVSIAEKFGISETVIGLTIISIGTSLPELITSIVASIKDENEIAVGNVVGSSIFNVLFVLGISTVIKPVDVGFESLYDMLILLAMTSIVFIYAASNKKIGSYKGASMVIIYAVYMVYIVLR